MRTVFSEALLRGVEYDHATETVYLDVSRWRVGNKPTDGTTDAGTALFFVVEMMRDAYPAYPVRQYVVKGVG